MVLSWLSLSCAGALLALGALKLWTTIGAIRWLRSFGPDYRRALELASKNGLDGTRIREIVESCHGMGVRPWGVLEFTLYNRAKWWQLFGRWIYRLPTLGWLALILYLVLPKTDGPIFVSIWAEVGIVYQLGVILMALEGVYAYIAIGNYRRYYHVGVRLDRATRPDVNDELYELDVLLPFVTSTIAINVLAFLTLQLGFDAFGSNTFVIDAGKTSTGALLLDAMYFVSTTLVTVGFGDITPKSGLGQIASILMHAQSLVFITGAFSALMSFGLRHVPIKGNDRSGEEEN